jgi:hypothetical protein
MTPLNQAVHRSPLRSRFTPEKIEGNKNVKSVCMILKHLAGLFATSDAFKGALTQFKRFSVSVCYSEVSSLISKKDFLSTMSFIGVYSIIDTKTHERMKHK